MPAAGRSIAAYRPDVDCPLVVIGGDLPEAPGFAQHAAHGGEDLVRCRRRVAVPKGSAEGRGVLVAELTPGEARDRRAFASEGARYGGEGAFHCGPGPWGEPSEIDERGVSTEVLRESVMDRQLIAGINDDGREGPDGAAESHPDAGLV